MIEHKIIIAGGRDFNDYQLVVETMAPYMQTDIHISIVSGMAKGADILGARYARLNGLRCYRFYAQWSALGKGAGYERNRRMGHFADELIAFWDGESKGTHHMIEVMHSLHKPVKIVRYEK